MNIEKLLQHMAWANQEIFGKVAELPDDALNAYLVNPEWTVREIIHHIFRSTHFYGYRLQINSLEDLQKGEELRAKFISVEKAPSTASDVRELLPTLLAADSLLLSESKLPDGVIYREWEGEIISRKRSTVISQSIYHATEHRAQLVSALEAKGFTTINLDDYDLWAFAEKFGE